MDSKNRTVYEGGQAEITEKRSRFIATVKPVKTEEEALEFIESLKKQYWDAAHNCFAYIIGNGSKMPLKRCSDDGEPQGTAGRPMLAVLEGESLSDVCVVVTRYFGGVLLGTGGLVRAYSEAVRAGLDASVMITRRRGVKLRIKVDYTGLGKIQYLLAKREIKTLESRYTEAVELTVLVPEKELAAAEQEITEATSAAAQLTEEATCVFALVDQEPVILGPA
ncbi:YigZ family protein [uncultured Merdimonas sp.]|uniref:YigZ family protein n=1 Tax=uncultured Merdimonas sp. TaxID=2023269 RepID=UPI00320A9AE3